MLIVSNDIISLYNGVSYVPTYGYNLATSYLEVFNSDWNNQNKINVKNYKIPSVIANLGMKLQIFDRIESIDLKSFSKNGTNKYIFLAGVLVDIETKEVIKTTKKWGPFVGQTEQGVYYDIYLNSEKTKINNITLGGPGDQEAKDIKVPEYLTQLNVPIQIQSNIKSLILEGDEILDLYWAYGLESIDIKNSKRYEINNGGVFDKKLNTMLNAPISGKRVNVLA